MSYITERENFRKQATKIAMGLVDQVEALAFGSDEDLARADAVFRRDSGSILRKLFSVGLGARAHVKSVGRTQQCSCGGSWRFKQHRSSYIETVLPGRRVELHAAYGICDRCGATSTPVRDLMNIDVDGFTVGLRELATLAGTVEPFEDASSELLERMVGVEVSSTKLATLACEIGERCDAEYTSSEESSSLPPAKQAAKNENVYVMVDGGMIHVDKSWHEAKVGLVFRESERVELSEKRAELLGRRVVATMGGVEDLEDRLWRQLEPMLPTTGDDVPILSKVVMIGDGAIWIWNMADRMLPGAIQIVDFYHACEHLAEVARLSYGSGSKKVKSFMKTNRKRLKSDRVEDVAKGIRFLGRKASGEDKEIIRRAAAYFTRNAERMRYATFRAQGLFIGSGAIESAIQHVVQLRMKRPGMRWKSKGAQAMLSLRAVYRSHGLWDAFWDNESRTRRHRLKAI